MDDPKAVAITGHRHLSDKDKATIWRSMQTLVCNPTISEILFGGAVGADTEALQAALLHRKGKSPRLTVVVPCREEDQPWAARKWFGQADKVIELGNPITSADRYESYHIRNRYLVDHAISVVAFWDGLPKSGTGSCVRYAKDKGVKLIHIPMGQK